MSTATKTRDLQTLSTSNVVVVDGHNPRGQINTEGDPFEELVASIKEHGVLQPILVGPAGDDGKHPIIAGHRRHAAAKKAGLKEIPAMVADLNGGGFAAAVAENLIREDMTPLQEARAIAHLRDVGKMKQVEVAKALGKSERWVRDRQKLLNLPEKAAARLNAGDVPLEALPELERVAQASPEAAEAVIELAIAGTEYGVDAATLKEPHVVARALAKVAPKAGLVKVARFGHEPGIGLDKLPISTESRKKLKPVWDEIPPGPYGGGRQGFRFDQDDAKTARVAKAYFEFGGDGYITDQELIAKLAEAKLPAMKKEAEKRVEQAGRTPQSTSDRAKAEERERKKREREAKMLEGANAELGERLASLSVKATDLDVVRLVCAMAIGDEPDDMIHRGVAALEPERYEEDEERERFRDNILLGELADAKTAAECLALVTRVALARAHYLRPGGDLQHRGWQWVPGAERFARVGEANVEVLLDDVGEKLGVLPKPAAKRVDSRRKERAAAAKREAVEVREREERLAEEAAAEAKAEAEAGETPADKALELITATPGIAAADIAKEMGLKPNYLYRILGRLEQEGHVMKDGRKYTAVATD